MKGKVYKQVIVVVVVVTYKTPVNNDYPASVLIVSYCFVKNVYVCPFVRRYTMDFTAPEIKGRAEDRYITAKFTN